MPIQCVFPLDARMVSHRGRRQYRVWVLACVLAYGGWHRAVHCQDMARAGADSRMPPPAGSPSERSGQAHGDDTGTEVDSGAPGEQAPSAASGLRGRSPLQEDVIHMTDQIDRQLLDDVVVGGVVGGVTGAAAGAGSGGAMASVQGSGLAGTIRGAVAGAALGAVGGAITGATVGYSKPDIAAAGAGGAGVGAAAGVFGVAAAFGPAPLSRGPVAPAPTAPTYPVAPVGVTFPMQTLLPGAPLPGPGGASMASGAGVQPTLPPPVVVTPGSAADSAAAEPLEAAGSLAAESVPHEQPGRGTASCTEGPPEPTRPCVATSWRGLDDVRARSAAEIEQSSLEVLAMAHQRARAFLSELSGRFQRIQALEEAGVVQRKP